MLLTHTERIAAAWGLGLGLLLVIGFAYDRWVLAVWWWPLVGSEWRAERRQRQGWGEDGTCSLCGLNGNVGAELMRSDDAWVCVNERRCSGRQTLLLDEPEPGWDDEPSTDDDADQMIATWHGTEPAEPNHCPHCIRYHAAVPIPCPVDWCIGCTVWPASDEEQEQLADVHPVYLDLSDDPDLIVWDAKQQADRCWEIVHIEFPRLRAELAHMWEAAA